MICPEINMKSGTIALSLVLVVLTYDVTLSQANGDKDAKYLILGGGIAGLAAAKNLAGLNETDFLLLEGDSRLGGRVKSEQLGGKTVEVGAQWLNSLTSPIGELAKRAGVVSQASDYDSYTIRDSTGADVSVEADARYAVFDKALEYRTDLSASLEEDQYKPDIPQRAALALGGWIPRDPIDHAIEYYDHEFVFGHQPETASTRFGFIPSLGDGSGYTEDVVIDQNGGLYKIIERLRDDVFEDNDPRYKLNHKVTNITYTDDGVTVTTTGGMTYTGDYAIVTFSLGVLQKEVVTFDPPLPDWKRYSIMGATFVTDSPVYAQFTGTFWDNTEFIMYGSERRGHYSLWQNFDKLIPGSGILQAQLSGAEARRIAQLEDNEIKTEIMAVLGKMYRETIPDPQILVPRWDTDPLHYGTYSDWSPHFTKKSHDALRAPVGQIYFAGEAYDAENYGYMEGAYYSAVRETNSLLECMRMDSKCENYIPPYEEVGCTYKDAKNYDDDALIDNGSCTFDGRSPTNRGTERPFVSLFLLILTPLMLLYFH